MKVVSRIFLLFWLLLAVAPLRAETLPSRDLEMVLHERTVNSFLNVIGNITGQSEYEVLKIKGDYTWSIINPHIELKPDKSHFVTDVNVKAGSLSYTTEVRGDVKIWYDSYSNNINIKVEKAVFGIYTKLFGKKFHIKDVDLANYLTDAFSFEGPLTMKTDVSVTMPDGTKKKVYTWPSQCALSVINKGIMVTCQLKFSETPPVPENIALPNEVSSSWTASHSMSLPAYFDPGCLRGQKET